MVLPFPTSELLRFGLAVSRRSARLTRRTILRAAPAIELFDDDLADMLGDQADDQVDDPFLVAAAVSVVRVRLPILHHSSDLFGDEMHDGVDDPLFVAVAVAAAAVVAVAAVVTVTIAVMIVIMIMMVIVMMVIAVAVALAAVPVARAAPFVASIPVVAVRPQHALERFEPFENLASIVVTHGRPPVGDWPNGPLPAPFAPATLGDQG